MKNLILTSHLLPTEDTSSLIAHIKMSGHIRDYIVTSKDSYKKSELDKDETLMHIYLCSTLPIKEGDWMIDRNYGKPSKLKYDKRFEPYLKNQCKKIEATTDHKLTVLQISIPTFILSLSTFLSIEIK